MLTLNTRILACIGIALTILLVVMTITSNALSNEPIPPPPSLLSKSTETPPAPEENTPQPQLQPEPSVEVQQPPPPLEPIAENSTIIPPLPPPPPSEHLDEDALRELDHAYHEIRDFEKILDYLEGKVTLNDEVLELWNKTLGFYNEAYQLYNSGNYILSRIYAHLAVEGVHGLREVLAYEVNEN